mgnify:CR=1 FL=1
MNTYYAYTKKITLQPNQRIDQELQLQADSDFIIERVYAIFNKPFKIQILDTTSNYNWFSNRIRSDAWFGTPQYPNELSKPIELLRNTLLKFDIENLDNSVNNIEIVFEGYRIYDKAISLSKDKYFCYVLDTELQALDMRTDFLKTNADTNFVIFKLYKYSDNDYSISLKMSASNLGGRLLNSEYTNIDNLFGSVLRPNILKHPITIDKNSILQFDFKNNFNSVEKLQIVLDGIKKFD